MKKLIHRGLHFFAVTICILFVALVIGVFFVIEKPRSIEFIGELMEESINKKLASQGIKVKIPTLYLKWDTIDKRLVLNADKIEVLQGTQSLFLLPEANFSYHPMWLMAGEWLPTEINIRGAVIRVPGEWFEKQPVSSKSAALPGVAFLQKLMQTLPMYAFNLVDSDLFIMHPTQPTIWHIQETSLRIEDRNLTLRASLDCAGEETSLLLTMTPGEEKTLFTLHFDDLPFHSSFSLLPIEFNALVNPFKQSKLIASGKIFGVIQAAQLVDTITLQFTEGAAIIRNSELFTLPQTLENLRLTAVYDIPNQHLMLQQGKFHFLQGTNLEIVANITSLLSEEKHLTLTAAAHNLPIDDLHKFWPIPLAKQVREWVLSHIFAGSVSRGVIHFNGQLNQEFGKLPKDAFWANIDFDGASLRYLLEHPVIEELTGRAEFNTDRILITAAKGRTSASSYLQEAQLILPFATNTDPLTLHAKVLSTIQDLLHYMPASYSKQLKEQGINFSHFNGRAYSDIQLTIPLEAENIAEEIKFQIHTNVSDAKGSEVIMGQPVREVNTLLELTQEGMHLKGKGIFINALTLFEITSHFRDLAHHFTVTSYLSPHDMEAIAGEPVAAFKAGIVNTFFDGNITKGIFTGRVRAQGKKAEIWIPEIGYHKMSGIPVEAIVEWKMKDAAKPATFQKLWVKGPEFLVNGYGSLTLKPLMLHHITLKKAKTPKINLQHLHYQHKPNLLSLELKGKSLDLSEFLASPSPQEKETSKQAQKPSKPFKWPGFNIHLEVDKLGLPGKEFYENVLLAVNCSPLKCSEINASFQEEEGKNPSYIELKTTPDQQRYLTASIKDVGKLLKGLLATDQVKKGNLSLNAMGDDVLKGNLIVKNFTVIKAPLLATLVAPFSSLPGILGMLENRGIPFERLTVPFTAHQGVIHIEDALAGSAAIVEKSGPIGIVKNLLSGSSIGFTASGDINLPKQTIDLEGTVFPTIYGLNNLFGLDIIPGVKTLLGGKGRGVIAANFKLNGNKDQVQVHVNPLSILTPGFLKKLFNTPKHSVKPTNPGNIALSPDPKLSVEPVK